MREITIEPEEDESSQNRDVVLEFKDDPEFYKRFADLLNSNAPFSVKITRYDGPRYFPARLFELLQCFPDVPDGKRWIAAYESLRKDNPSSAELSARSFKQSFGKSFENPVNERWDAFEEVVSNKLGLDELDSAARTTQVMPMGNANASIVALTRSVTKLAGSMWYGPQYVWSWARNQDKKRLSYVTGLTAAGAGTGAIGGPVGSAVAAVVGLTTGVMTSGNRMAHVTVSKDHPDSDTSRSPWKQPVAVITFQ